MSANRKQAQKLARQLFKLSLDGKGVPSAELVAGVLEYIEKHKPAHSAAALREYQRMMTRELARSRAVVEHAGSISPELLERIASALSGQYSRPISASARLKPELIAGLRVRLGDDVYESSVAGRLAALSASC